MVEVLCGFGYQGTCGFTECIAKCPFCFNFLKLSFPELPEFEFSLLMLFPLSGVINFYSLDFIDCLCLLKFLYVIIFSLSVSIIFTKTILISLSCASGMLQFSGWIVEVFWGSSRNILSCYLLIAFSSWYLATWI